MSVYIVIPLCFYPPVLLCTFVCTCATVIVPVFKYPCIALCWLSVSLYLVEYGWVHLSVTGLYVCLSICIIILYASVPHFQYMAIIGNCICQYIWCFCLYVCLCVCLFICMSLCLSACPSVCLPVRLSVRLSKCYAAERPSSLMHELQQRPAMDQQRRPCISSVGRDSIWQAVPPITHHTVIFMRMLKLKWTIALSDRCHPNRQ